MKLVSRMLPSVSTTIARDHMEYLWARSETYIYWALFGGKAVIPFPMPRDTTFSLSLSFFPSADHGCGRQVGRERRKRHPPAQPTYEVDACLMHTWAPSLTPAPRKQTACFSALPDPRGPTSKVASSSKLPGFPQSGIPFSDERGGRRC